MSTENEQTEEQAKDVHTYNYPVIDLLDGASVGNQEDEKTWATRIEEVFRVYRINASVAYVVLGLRVVTFAIQLGRGMRINNFIGYKSEIELGLGGEIEFAIPLKGTSYIGIYLQTDKRIDVNIRTLLESSAFTETQAMLPIVLGMSSKGEIVIDDLSICGHLLVGGTTGSGKTVFLNQIILGLLYKTEPSKVRMIFADESGLNLSIYNGIPNLMLPVLTEREKMINAMHWAMYESMQRKEKILAEGVKNIDSFNELGSERRLPHIVIIFDEYDALLEHEDDVETLYKVLTMGKQVGIHWILAAQKVTPKTISQNLQHLIPCRVGLDVTSARESRAILGISGAEYLEGNGDMLYHRAGWQKPIRINGGMVTDEEVRRVVNWICQQ